MAVPKKRTGASAQGHRRSNWKATVPETTVCKNCGEIILTHTVCEACGQYKGKVVSRKAEGFVEEAEAKKPAKKASKPRVSKKAKTAEPVVEAAEVKETKKKKNAPAETEQEVKEEKTEE